MLKKFLKNDKGLTLVELLAVIVILGIIAAIAVPSIGNIIEKSRADAIKAEGTQVLNAAKLYLASEGDLATGETLKPADIADYITENDDDLWVVGNGEGATAYSISRNEDNVLQLTGNAKKGNVEITFTNATIKGINDYTGKTGTIAE